MSWSVSAAGPVADVKTKLTQDFQSPLYPQPGGLADDGERGTVHIVQALLAQCLDTFGPEKTVQVSAYGHMGFGDWTTKEGRFQELTISIKPTG